MVVGFSSPGLSAFRLAAAIDRGRHFGPGIDFAIIYAVEGEIKKAGETKNDPA